MPSGYTLRLNYKHAHVAVQIRNTGGTQIRNYTAEDTILPGEQVKVIRDNNGSNQIVAVEIEIKPPNGSWEFGNSIMLGGALANTHWSITEIGMSALCDVLPIYCCGGDDIPPYPGW